MNGYEPESGWAGWFWYCRILNPPWESRSDVPPEVFKALCDYTTWRRGWYKGYPTRQAALQALGEAMGRAEKQ